MVNRKRPKSIRKAKAKALSREEKLYSKVPHTFIFSQPGVGALVKQLGLDLREVFGPYTASNLHVTRRNVLKDFITIAGPLNVTHLMYLTHPNVEKRMLKRERKDVKKKSKLTNYEDLDLNGESEHKNGCDSSIDHPLSQTAGGAGGVYFHMIRVPHGPSFTFRVLEYSLKRDVLTLIRRVFDRRQYTNPPLLVMVGFGMNNSASSSSTSPEPHLRLMVDMFQNMLPPLNVQKLKLNTVRRVLLVSREVQKLSDNTEQDVIYFRHYHIRTEDRRMSRPLRRLGMGGAKLKTNQKSTKTFGGMGPSGIGKSSGVPSLAKYTSMDEFLTKSGLLSDSALSDALSDMEEVDLLPSLSTSQTASVMLDAPRNPDRKSSIAAGPMHGLKHLSTSKKATIRLTEIGPRLCLSLIKIEEGVNTGSVLYHRWHLRTLAQLAEQSIRISEREQLRSSRRTEHEARRLANEAARVAHRHACLKGMKRVGDLVDLHSDGDGEDESDKHFIDDDDELSKQEKRKRTVRSNIVVRKKLTGGINATMQQSGHTKTQKRLVGSSGNKRGRV